jgi:hypothetical protein
MKCVITILIVLVMSVAAACAQGKISQVPAAQNNVNPSPSAVAEPTVAVVKPTIILLVSEQNIEGPQHAWWASEIDLSATEAKIASRLLEKGFTILDPSQLTSRISQKPAFRVLAISDQDSVKLGNLAKADYVVLGKALASSGPNVPSSNMRSCFANITAKVIRVKDGKVISYLEASGNSAHLDVITGGKEALVRAADSIAMQLNAALEKEGGK